MEKEKINYNNMNLSELLEEIRSRFRIKLKQRHSIICFNLIYWQNGYWSIDVIDDWHKWSDKNIKKLDLLFITPESACIEFLKHIDKNKINLRKLQSK